MDLKDIKAIIDLMKKNSISEFELERQDFKIKLKRGAFGTEENLASAYAPQMASLPAMSPSTIPGAPSVNINVAAPAPSNEIEIKSPMIGTFYRAPSPEAANYIEIGSEVNSETVVCIIEAMKVMNEIKSEVRGVITQILVDNAKPVEFGQPLFKVRPL